MICVLQHRPGELKARPWVQGHHLTCISRKLLYVLSLVDNASTVIKSAVNGRALINRLLPPELLIHIFSLVPEVPHALKESYEGKICGPFHFKDATYLLPATQVCRHWRNIALDTPTLWTSLSSWRPLQGSFFGYPSRTALHFTRLWEGMTIPLYVAAEAPNPTEGRFAGRCQPFFVDNGRCIEELHVAIDCPSVRWDSDTELEASLGASLSFTPHSLARLTLNGLGRRDVYHRCHDHSIFGGHTLNLRTLAMHDVPFLPTNPVSSTLTHLVLTHNLDWGAMDEGLPISKVLRLLSGASSLQEVYIDGLINFNAPIDFDESTQTAVPSAPSRVLLPSVRKFLAAPGSAAAKLLSALDLPSHCLIRLKADPNNKSHIKDIHKMLSERFVWCQTKVHCTWSSSDAGSPVSTNSVQAIRHRDAGGGGIRVDQLARGGRSKIEKSTVLFVHCCPTTLSSEQKRPGYRGITLACC